MPLRKSYKESTSPEFINTPVELIFDNGFKSENDWEK